MLACQKDHFRLPEDLHYLNCAYMAPRSDRVEAAGIAAIQRHRIPTQITPELFFSESDRLRSLFAQLINASPSRVALMPSVSYGIATIARNLKLSAAQKIILMHEQFPSNVYAWRRLSEETGCRIETVRAPDDGANRGRHWNERILDAIDRNTGVISMGQIHWADGTRFDMDAIAARAREVGAALVVDGTQSLGAMPFDVQRYQPDAIVCAGYKWLLGPYGLGAAYYGPRFDNGVPLEESWLTRHNSQDFAGLVQYEDRYQPGAIRYDMGERSSFNLVPMLHAALEHLLDWGVDRIQEYCARLTRDLIHDARQLGYLVEDEAWRSCHMFGIRLPEGVSMDALKQALGARNVVVSFRGNAVRVSPNVYNDAGDVARLVEALEEAAQPQRNQAPRGQVA